MKSLHSDDTSVALVIYGYDNVSQLTDHLKLKPDHAFNKGEIQPGHKVPAELSYWAIGSKLDSSAPLEEHIQSLLDQVSPYEEVISKIAKEYKTVISVGSYYYESNAETVFDPNILARISKLGVSLWLDMYFSWGYLNEDRKVEELSRRLNSLKAIKQLSGDGHDEGLVLARALSVFESASSGINSNLANFFDDRVTKEAYLLVLKEIIEELAELKEALGHSKYLSSTE